MNTALMAISPLDGRYEEKMAALRTIFSEFGLIKWRVTVEVRWLETLADDAAFSDIPPLGPDAKQILNDLVEHFSQAQALRVKNIEAGIKHDVKAVEYFIKEHIEDNPELTALSEFIHFGCTSEDINNLAYGLMLKTARTDCLLPAINDIIEHLQTFAHTYAQVAMLSRTHGQPASPTTVGKEMANVIARLKRQVDQLACLPILGKFNGATGNYNALAFAYPDINWETLSDHFVSSLGLTWNPYTTQIEPHDACAEYFAILVRINTILIDLNRDIWGYISIQYFSQKSFANEVGSSTMPHKINPIDFENSEGNLGIANALFEHMIAKLPISRWQRDLSDSTVLRNIGVAIGHSLLAYQAACQGLLKLEPNIKMIKADLDNHWEVLAEPIQTVMRRYKLHQPYEQLKDFTRGKDITKELLQQFITQLTLPDHVKNQLLALEPKDYIGYAEELARGI